MKQTRCSFTHDALISVTKKQCIRGLNRLNTPEIKRSLFTNIHCIMSGLALFTFKMPSLLQFDRQTRPEQPLALSLKNLFQIEEIPSDTYLRERLDVISPSIFRQCFTGIFALLQRSKILDHFKFLKDYYLISLDGTGVFSSKSIHCEHCCTKNHRDGTVTYHHQILAAALVHPEQKVVYPLAPEPILNTDGAEKNDCERNALKRWVKDFRREHPHLKTIIIADGLSSNEPFISILKEHKLSYILVCKEGDHKYLIDWLNAADREDKPTQTKEIKNGTQTYSYMLDVPLNASKDACRVNVVCLNETIKGKTTKWIWVTDLAVTLENVEEIAKGGRSRWKIENETFNTLKNQGYQFEHNFGHGRENLHTVFAHLMMLAFFVDQVLAAVNKRFQAVLDKYKAKYVVWEKMRAMLEMCILPDFETLYQSLVTRPPPMQLPSVL